MKDNLRPLGFFRRLSLAARLLAGESVMYGFDIKANIMIVDSLGNNKAHMAYNDLEHWTAPDLQAELDRRVSNEIVKEAEAAMNGEKYTTGYWIPAVDGDRTTD